MADTAPAPLDKLDPAEAWQPWRPKEGEWGLKWAGHLFRRAAFGASLPELRQAVLDGLAATLDRLLDGQPGADDRQTELTKTGKNAFDSTTPRTRPDELRSWWLYMLLHTKHPLREKLTLFWHDHFATSIAKVASTKLMFRQNVTLREHALGKFPDFLLAVSKDPAMLLWLDGNSNVKGKPNENYAREVMELFSLGVGNYTEKDIREAARAFTGWRVENDEFTFNPNFHDDGAKTIFGKTGKFGGKDVLRLCLEKDAAARFLVRKLYRHLVSEEQTPPDAFLEPLAASFRKGGYDVKALVRQVLGSRHFFSDHAYRRKIKGPVEFVFGAVYALTKLTDRELQQSQLLGPLEAMGQQLFAPPNVKGWPGGEAWLNTSTVLARHNFARALVTGKLPDAPPGYGLNAQEAQIQEIQERAREEALRQQKEAEPLPPAPPAGRDVARLVKAEKAATPEAAVGVLADVLLQGDIGAKARGMLAAFLKDGKPEGAAYDHRLREAAHMIMTMPEYQLC
jgi:uncharacterized protein (DUF1800 family)